MRRILAATLVLTLSAHAGAIEYTCPTDPGFCYFDVANDGCFDSATDIGPIDAQLAAGPYPVPLPPGTDLPTDPGSIVCPPKAKKIVLATGLDWRTAPGSHIRLFRTKLSCSDDCSLGFAMRSGGELFFDGKLTTKSDPFQDSFVHLEAQDDVWVGTVRQGKGVHDIDVVSATGDVVLAPKARFRASRLNISSAGEIRMGTGARVDLAEHNQPPSVWTANGAITMTRPTFLANRAGLSATGTSITILEKARFKPITKRFPEFEFIATSGDVSIESFVIHPRTRTFSLTGNSIYMGTSARSSKARLIELGGALLLSASDEIAIRRADLGGRTLSFETTGTEVSITDSRILGAKPPFPNTATIQTGPGSTCDLAGTFVFPNIDLVENCGTILGP